MNDKQRSNPGLTDAILGSPARDAVRTRSLRHSHEAKLVRTVMTAFCAGALASVAGVACGGGATENVFHEDGQVSRPNDNNYSEPTHIFEPSSSGGQDYSCAGETRKADLAPIDMYIMLDATGSMRGIKWTSTISALQSFVQDPRTGDSGVALQFFSFPKAQMCDVASYASPAVPMASAAQNATAITQSLQAHEPGGWTAMRPALDGAIQYATSWGQANPTHVPVVVLATDGIPNECDSTVENVSELAARGLASNPSVRTFVIGVGKSLTKLNQIARAGGRPEGAFLVTDSGDVSGEFFSALEEIRGTSLSCDYVIPTPSSGSIDPEKVNVEYKSASSEKVSLKRVESQDACSQDGNDWYYDDPASPKRVVMCSKTCDTLKTAENGGEMRVVFGCKSRVI